MVKLKIKNNTLLIINRVLLVIVSLISTGNIFSEESQFHFDRIDVNDGLSQNLVITILQDSKGFMWFGTNDGLNKFDGINFKIFRNIPFDSTSISGNRILSIYEDKFSNIWIGTNSGLNRFDPVTEKFQRFEEFNKLEVNAICEDKNNNIWFVDRTGEISRLLFSKEGNKKNYFSNYYSDKITLGRDGDKDFVFNLLHVKNDIWVTTKRGIIKYFYTESEEIALKKYAMEEVHTLYRDKWGTIWAGGFGCLYSIVDEKNPIITKYFLPKLASNQPLWMRRINGISEDNEGNLWLASHLGVLIFNKTTKETKLIIHQNNNPNSLSSSSIISILKDRGNVFWFGTSGYGINKYSEHTKKFNFYSCGYGDKRVQSINSILIDSNNTLWFVALGRKIFSINRKNGVVTKPSFNNILTNARSTLYKGTNGDIWISNVDKIFKHNIFTHKTKKINIKRLAEEENKVLPLIQEFIGIDKNVLWFTSQYAIRGINLETEEFINYQFPAKEELYISTTVIDRSHNFWIAAQKKLYKFDTIDKTWKYYLHNEKNSKSISSNQIKSIFLDPVNPKQFIWFGTDGSGLNKFNVETEEFTLFTTDDGLPNNVVYGILSDGENKFWLSTNYGLSHFDPVKLTFQNFNVFDGLQSNEFNTDSFCKSKSGEMFFGGIGGITYFNPTEIDKNPNIPNVVVTEFRLFNKIISPNNLDSPLKETISETKEINLSYSQNNMSFKFVSLDFTSPKNNKYLYRLENFDKDWIEGTKERLAVYSHLPSGEYIFRVKASNNDGVWNNKGTAIKIIIAPPYWATWWAYFFYILTISVILFGVIKYYKKRALLYRQIQIGKIEKESLKELSDLKSKFYAGISHEFRTPLTLILGPIYEMLDEVKDKEKKQKLELVRKNGERLIELVNQLLDLSKSEAQKMSVNFTQGNIVVFIDGLLSKFKNYADSKGVQINYAFENDSIIMDFDKDVIEKIISNLVSNAIKFINGAGEVFVSVSEIENKVLLISIQDTGIGISKNELENIFNSFYQITENSFSKNIGTGIGLALVKELVTLHKGEIFVQSEEESGTVFNIKLPIKTLAKKVINNTETNESDIVMHEENKGDKKIVLIVEDLKDMRKFIVQTLADEYSILEAVDGEEGIIKAKEILPDIIISDIMMPKKDGLELSRVLKADEKTSHIPIILLTAKADEESKLEGLETGADNYLTKPFNPKELNIRVRNLLKLQKKIREQIREELFDTSQKAKAKSKDEIFMEKILTILEDNIEESNFGVEELANKIFMSKSQLYRKVKALTDYSPVQLILNYRLKKAAELIKEDVGSVTEIAFKVGFNNLGYFSQTFKKEFGVSPNKYRK